MLCFPSDGTETTAILFNFDSKSPLSLRFAMPSGASGGVWKYLSKLIDTFTCLWLFAFQRLIVGMR